MRNGVEGDPALVPSLFRGDPDSAHLSARRTCGGGREPRVILEDPMPPVKLAIDDFLAQKRIAVAGVSRTAGAHSGNAIYLRLKERGYTVFAVNPNADEINGEPCYRSLAAIPGGVDAVLIATAPAAAPSVVAECKALGITRVWMHRSFGGGSVSAEAHDQCRQAGIVSIAGGCPLMYGATSDGGHRFMRWLAGAFGQLPKEA
jgi:predicted CoA-binding protein